MSIVSQGRFLGKPSSFKYRKSGGIGSGINLSAKRKDSLEKRAIGDKQDKEAARTKEVSRREKESKQRQRQMVKGVSEETDTEKRQKVVAVSRPDTAKTPLDARSKLYKQTEIKNKIIDENEVKSMTFQKYHNLPDSLVSAVTAVLERVKNPFIDDDKKMKSKKDDDQDDDDDTNMKSKKNDDLDDEDEDDSDKMIGTSGKKTKVELKPKTQSANEELKGKQHKLDKNKNGRLDKHDFKLLRKEETELDEAMKWDKKSHASLPAMDQPSLKAHKEAANWHRENYEDSSGDAKQYHKKRMLHHTTQADAMKSMSESLDEAKGLKHYKAWGEHGPTGNDYIDVPHVIKAKSAEHAKSMAVSHLKKNHSGIWGRIGEGNVHVNEIKKDKKSVAESKQFDIGLSDEETQRILTKLKESDDKAYKYRDTDPADKDNDYDATKDKNPEHIVMQLRKAKSLGAANRPIHFHDGSKVKVSSAHVQKALDMHGSFKRAPAKDEFTQKLQASHSSFKKALGE
jgi:hypothetical protein